MKTSIKAVLAALGVATLLGGATAASADTQWQRNHPRREEVNHRLAMENHRIREERREGDLSPRQAHRLHERLRAIRIQERMAARHHGGHLTRAEQRRLNHEENKVSGRIGH